MVPEFIDYGNYTNIVRYAVPLYVIDFVVVL